MDDNLKINKLYLVKNHPNPKPGIYATELENIAFINVKAWDKFSLLKITNPTTTTNKV